MSLDRAGFRSLRDGVIRNAAARPEAPALQVLGRTISYAELVERALGLAGGLLHRLGRRPERVGILASRNEVTYVGILAALMAGATYVPLNRRFPVERTRSMIRRGALDAIVVDAPSAHLLPVVLEGMDATPVVFAPEKGTDLAQISPSGRCEAAESQHPIAAELLPPVVPDDIAYLLFTSGTTGEPKGVSVSHANVLHLLDVLLGELQYGPHDRVSQHFDHTFDVSVFDLFATWEAGGCVCVPQATDLLAPGVFVNKHELTVWFSVPSLVAQMRLSGQLRPEGLPTLRLSMFAGEAMPRATMEAWQLAACNARVINMYGPTETTIVCSGYEWNQLRSPSECVNDLVPIGKMFPGVGALVIDEHLHEVGEGEPGELCIAGPLTCPGYWRDAEKTIEKFVSLPIGPFETRRFYRTGDRVTRLGSGDYAFLGRIDHQIKVRGYRIELGEIEAILLQDPAVTSAAAIGWPLEDGRPQGIVAFVVGSAPDAATLSASVRLQLPPYMNPEEIVVLDVLPLNANGKTDRAALQALLRTRDGGTS